ncbi:MAG TPA: trehalose-6-phosphate synthase [Acidimicrobiia bacterium]|nr:trehalose-6-phosphate synthase [Acidimicrobiia bacterium]
MTVVLSNRGPYRYEPGADGTYVARPGAGGLASSLAPLLLSGAAGGDSTWIAAALSDADRGAVRAGAVHAAGVDLRLLDVDPQTFRAAYEVVSNGTLWFLYHGLFDLTRRPRFDGRWREAWESYEAANVAFADAAAELADDGEVVLVQDMHLALVPGLLRAHRPDLRLAHFTHTPFCGPNSIRVLPDYAATALCASMAAAPCGFHARRWAQAYEASAREILGAALSVPTFVAPLGPDPDALTTLAASDEARHAAQELDGVVGDRALVLRVDRIDPSKNIVRGFLAYDLLLERHPEWRERVSFVARLNASRETLAEYQAYRQEVETAAARVNDRWGTSGWAPVVVDTKDDYPSTVAAMGRYDVLVVNAIKDGLNLVAKEGPLLNRRDGVVCLSPDAGAWDDLGTAAVRMHPFDLEQAADALHQALSMPAEERAGRAATLRELAGARTPKMWFDDQLIEAR